MLRFNVPGVPKPQGSKRGFIVGGRVNLVEASGNDLKAWRQAITLTARRESAHQKWELTNHPLHVSLDFMVIRPARPKFTAFPAVKPDIDKLARAVLDALTDAKTVWVDDCQVVTLYATKSYGFPGVAVTVRT